MAARINLQPSVGRALADHKASHIAGRNAQLTAQSQHNMGIILTHTGALVQGLLGRGAGVGGIRLINKAMIELVTHAQCLLHGVALLLGQCQIRLHAMGERGLWRGIVKNVI